MRRELKEEINIKNPYLKMIHSQQSINQSDGRTYYNFYFEVSEYTDTIVNLESEKCSELLFLDTDCLEKEKVAPYVKVALEEIKK
jgi:ADP-ribose pyrophosphatase YjhB (NUDIX family)